LPSAAALAPREKTHRRRPDPIEKPPTRPSTEHGGIDICGLKVDSEGEERTAMTALFKKMFGSQEDFQAKMRSYEFRTEGMACGKKGDYAEGPAASLTQANLRDPELVMFPSAEFMKEKFMKTASSLELELANRDGINTRFPEDEREQVRNLFYYARFWDNEVWNWETEEWDGV
jgi:hypothetical protein